MRTYTQAERRKPLDDAIKAYNKRNKTSLKEVTYVSRLEQEIATLKTSLHKAGELIEELKKENKFLQLPLNERIEKEYINKRENEDNNKKEAL